MWQALREELKPHNFEVLTVALDSGGAEAARPWIERAKSEHPALIDERHVVADLYGIINVATAVWIDEDGIIVRPPETPATNARVAEMLGIGPTAYLDALRDWAKNGASSEYIPSAHDRRARRALPDADRALAAANFRLGEYLFATGATDDARKYFERAVELHPENWTYRRQYWANYDPQNNANRVWYEAAMSTGDTPYYEPVQLGDAPTADRAATAQKQRDIYEALFKRAFAPDD